MITQMQQTVDAVFSRLTTNRSPSRTVADRPLTDEADLIRRAQHGDHAAFTALMTAHRRTVYAVALRMMSDPDDAADVLQDVFVRAYQAIGRTRPDLRVGPWLATIAANRCLDLLRRRQRLRWERWDRIKHAHLLLSEPADDPERAALRQEARATVRQVLGRMSQRHRRALVLREYDGLNCQEISGVMGLSRSAVKSMLFRAREEFRRTTGALETTETIGSADRIRCHRARATSTGTGP